MNKTILLVDANWLLMSCASIVKDLQDINIALPKLMTKSLNTTLKVFPTIDSIILCADGGASWRKTQIKKPDFINKFFKNDDYKGTRNSKDSDFWKNIFSIYENFLNTYKENGINVYKEYNIEGDDLCWYLSKQINKNNDNCIIWSRDKDLSQLVNTTENFNFTIMYSKKDGITAPIIINDIDFLEYSFMNTNVKHNIDIYNNTLKCCNKLNYIDIKNVILHKIFIGDIADNVLPAIFYVKNNRTYKMTDKDINVNIDWNNNKDVEIFVNNIISTKKFLNKSNYNINEILEHINYNKKLVLLSETSFPDVILKKLNNINYNNILIYNYNIIKDKIDNIIGNFELLI